MQNPSPEDIDGRDIMEMKVLYCRYATFGLRELYKLLVVHACFSFLNLMKLICYDELWHPGSLHFPKMYALVLNTSWPKLWVCHCSRYLKLSHLRIGIQELASPKNKTQLPSNHQFFALSSIITSKYLSISIEPSQPKICFLIHYHSMAVKLTFHHLIAPCGWHITSPTDGS